jgi:hypothetical protein
MRYWVLIIVCTLIACGNKTKDPNSINIDVTRLASGATACNWTVTEAAKHCRKIWSRHIAVPLQFRNTGDITPPSEIGNNDQESYFWSVYSAYPYSNSGTVWLVVAPSFPTGDYGGLAVPCSYKHPDMSPVAMVFSFPAFGYNVLGELMCHEIAHTVGMCDHSTGPEFSPASIQRIHEYLSAINRRKIRRAREKYILARANKQIGKAAHYKRIWRYRRRVLFRL